MQRPLTRDEFDALLLAFRKSGISHSGQCLMCLTVQRRHRRDERL